MIKLTAEQAVFYLSLLSSRQVICVRTRAGPLGPLWGCAVGRVHQMLSLFSSLHIINPVSSPGMVYWQVQGWAPIFNTKSWTEVPGCWLGWFNTFSPSRQHKHTCSACRLCFMDWVSRGLTMFRLTKTSGSWSWQSPAYGQAPGAS